MDERGCQGRGRWAWVGGLEWRGGHCAVLARLLMVMMSAFTPQSGAWAPALPSGQGRSRERDLAVAWGENPPEVKEPSREVRPCSLSRPVHLSHSLCCSELA